MATLLGKEVVVKENPISKLWHVMHKEVWDKFMFHSGHTTLSDGFKTEKDATVYLNNEIENEKNSTPTQAAVNNSVSGEAAAITGTQVGTSGTEVI